MKASLTCMLLVAASQVSALEGSKKPVHYQIIETDRETIVKQPRVDDFYQCSRCLANSENNQICLQYGMNWEIGWEWAQSFEEESYYRIGVDFYTKQGGGMRTIFDVPRVYYNKFQAQIDTYRTSVMTQATYYYSSNTLCFDVLRNYDDYLLDVEMNMRLWECYINIINCFYSFENWTGPDAKWIDLCYESSDEDLDLYTKQWQAAEAVTYIYGTGVNRPTCWKMPFASGNALDNRDPNIFEQWQGNLVQYTIKSLLSQGNILGKEPSPELLMVPE